MDWRHGVDQPYETPENPELHLMAGEASATALAWGTGAAQDFLDRSLRIGCERSRSTTETRQLACYPQRTSSGVDGQRGLIPMNAS